MPDLLVIQVGLATGQGKFMDLVREAQRRVLSSVGNVRYVDAKGLAVAKDYTHLTTPAQVKLGTMLANSYLATLAAKLSSLVRNQNQLSGSLVMSVCAKQSALSTPASTICLFIYLLLK